MSPFILYLLLFWIFLLSSKHAHHIQKLKCSNTFRIKKPLNEFLSYPNVTWRLTVRLYFKMNSNYTIWGDSYFLSSLYTVLHVRFEFGHISFPPTHQPIAIGVDFDVWTTIASVCRLNCKFPESLGIFNWNLSHISKFPFGLSRFVNHKKTRPHWFGRKLSQTEKENRTDTPYSSANIFVYKLETPCSCYWKYTLLISLFGPNGCLFLGFNIASSVQMSLFNVPTE